MSLGQIFPRASIYHDFSVDLKRVTLIDSASLIKYKCGFPSSALAAICIRQFIFSQSAWLQASVCEPRAGVICFRRCASIGGASGQKKVHGRPPPRGNRRALQHLDGGGGAYAITRTQNSLSRFHADANIVLFKSQKKLWRGIIWALLR